MPDRVSRERREGKRFGQAELSLRRLIRCSSLGNEAYGTSFESGFGKPSSSSLSLICSNRQLCFSVGIFRGMAPAPARIPSSSGDENACSLAHFLAFSQ